MKKLKLTPTLLVLFFIPSLIFAQSGWFRLTPNSQINQNLINIEILNENNFYILADSGCFLKSNDGGINIVATQLDFTPSAINFLNLNTGFASNRNKLCKTTNAGLTWDTVYKYIPSMQTAYVNINEIKFYSENFGYIYVNESVPLVAQGKYLITTNGGISWNTAASTYNAGTSSGWNALSVLGHNFFPNGTGFTATYGASGSFGNITSEQNDFSKTTNFGLNWTSILSNTGVTKIVQTSFANQNEGYAVSDSGKILKTTDGGATWNFIAMKPQNSGSKFFMIDVNNGYFHNQYNEYYRTTNGCQTWDLQTVAITGSQFIGEISFLNPQLGYIVGKSGQIFKTTTGGTVSVTGNSQAVNSYFLSQNYPNPFNPETKILFAIPKNGFVKIAVYDLMGKEVKQLVNNFMQQGSYSVSFNGSELSSGIYFYKLITDDFVETKKMILVK